MYVYVYIIYMYIYIFTTTIFFFPFLFSAMPVSENLLSIKPVLVPGLAEVTRAHKTHVYSVFAEFRV